MTRKQFFVELMIRANKNVERSTTGAKAINEERNLTPKKINDGKDLKAKARKNWSELAA